MYIQETSLGTSLVMLGKLVMQGYTYGTSEIRYKKPF